MGQTLVCKLGHRVSSKGNYLISSSSSQETFHNSTRLTESLHQSPCKKQINSDAIPTKLISRHRQLHQPPGKDSSTGPRVQTRALCLQKNPHRRPGETVKQVPMYKPGRHVNRISPMSSSGASGGQLSGTQGLPMIHSRPRKTGNSAEIFI